MTKLNLPNLFNLDEAAIKEFHPSQDFYKGRMYYGLKKDNKSMIIDSEGKLNILNQLKFKGLQLIIEKIASSNFPLEMLGSKISDLKVDPRLLFSELKIHFKKYLYLPDDRYFDVLALWTMGTYIFKIFPSFPYLRFNAEKNSGKTTALELLKGVCFNAVLSSYTTKAATYRLIHSNLATLLMDEAENLSGQYRKLNPHIIEILNSGYKANGSVLLSDEDPKNTLKLLTYSPKVFAGIGDIVPILRDRTIEIPINRKPPGYKLYDLITNDEQLLRQLYNIRAYEYLFGLKYANKIYELYKDQNDEEFTKINNRSYELWSPLIALSKLIDGFGESEFSIREKIVKVAEEHTERRKSDENGSNEDYGLIQELIQIVFPQEGEISDYDCSYLGPIVRITTEEFFSKLKAKKIIPFDWTKTRLTQWLTKRNLAVSRVSSSERNYLLNVDEIHNYAKSYFPKEEEITDEDYISTQQHF